MKRLEGLHRVTLGEWLREPPAETASRLDELHRCLWKLGIRKQAHTLRVLAGHESPAALGDRLSAQLEHEASLCLDLLELPLDAVWPEPSDGPDWRSSSPFCSWRRFQRRPDVSAESQA